MVNSKIQFALPVKTVMKNRYNVVIALVCIGHMPITANPIISFFFKPYFDGEQFTEKLKKPGKAAKHTIQGLMQHISVAGICTTYFGYIASSDDNGEIRFPRKHREDTIDVIITTQLEPIAFFENTIDHWEIVPGVPTQVYSLKENYNETDKNYEWLVEKKESPSNKVVPLTAIVIIAKPKNVFIPLETTPTLKTANLVLPSVFVKRGTNIVLDGAYVLNIRHFFKPVDLKTQKSTLRLTTHLLD